MTWSSTKRAALAVFLAATLPVPLHARPASEARAFAAFDAAIKRTKADMMGDPKGALSSARAAVALSFRLPPAPRTPVDALTAQWLHGEALIGMNDLAAAAPVIAAALVEAERVAPNTKLHGDLLRAQGAIAAETGKITQALRDYQLAHDVFFKAGEARSRAMALQDIGGIYMDAGDYDRTLSYYEQSGEAYGADPVLTLTRQNNRAEVFRKRKRFTEAATAYRAALVQAKKLGSPLLQVRILSNLALSEADANRLASAQMAVDQARALARHGDAVGWRPFVYGAAARVAAGRGAYALAAELLARTFDGVDLAKTDLLFREYHLTAAQVYEAQGNIRRALDHAKAFQRLEGEVQQLTASAASQLMAARFDFTNQNLKIAKLREEQQARELEAERDRSRSRTILFGALLAAGAFVFGLLLFGYFTLRRSRDAVTDANNSLTQVNGELEKALKAKTEFLATTSHEIRTPLNGILGMTQVLLADRNVEPGVRERIEVVHGAGETMKALVDDILDVAKMESGELTVAHEPTELARILDDAARLWAGQAQAKGLELVLDTETCPRRIMSDGGRLRQIIFNLMSNALKFTAEGRVTLFAGVDGDDRLLIRVTDTGIGIPVDAQADIFEAFRQVDGGVTRQFGGTGLGLAICRQLAQALGGEVGVESAVGQGSTFTVTLPLERAEPEPVAAADEPEADTTLAAARILLVERNPLNQGVMRVLLGAEAGSVTVRASAAEAVEALASGEATHLLIDAGSAADEGADVVPALREAAHAARQAGAHCTVLLNPATAGPTIAEAMMLGASQLIVKPIGAADLLAALRSLYGDDPETLVAPSLLNAA